MPHVSGGGLCDVQVDVDEGVTESPLVQALCVCVCVCVCVRERESVCVCMHMYVCVFVCTHTFLCVCVSCLYHCAILPTFSTCATAVVLSMAWSGVGLSAVVIHVPLVAVHGHNRPSRYRAYTIRNIQCTYKWSLQIHCTY